MKMNSEKKIRIAFTITVLALLWALIRMEQYKSLSEKTPIEVIGGGDISKAQTIDSLQHVIDSLYMENFPCQVELGRYQVAYQIFMERNPKAASQYGDIISEETE
jgi:hypothetical protein